MKNVIVMMVLSLFTAGGFAQEKKERADWNSAEAIEKRVDRMAEQLQLNDAQRSQLIALYTEKAEQRKEFTEKKSEMNEDERAAYREEMTTRMQEKREAHKAQLQDILTPEQYTRWEELKANRKADMKKKKGFHRGDKKDRKRRK